MTNSAAEAISRAGCEAALDRAHAATNDEALAVVTPPKPPRSLTPTERIIREIRTLGMFDTPAPSYLAPPHDYEAERSVLEACFYGRRRTSDLESQPSDFYVPIHQGILAVLAVLEERGMRPRLKLVMQLLELDGASRERTARYLRELVYEVPMRVDVDDLDRRIKVLSQRRKAIALMQRVDNLWRCGERANDHLVVQLLDAIEATRDRGRQW